MAKKSGRSRHKRTSPKGTAATDKGDLKRAEHSEHLPWRRALRAFLRLARAVARAICRLQRAWRETAPHLPTPALEQRSCITVSGAGVEITGALQHRRLGKMKDWRAAQDDAMEIAILAVASSVGTERWCNEAERVLSNLDTSLVPMRTIAVFTDHVRVNATSALPQVLECFRRLTGDVAADVARAASLALSRTCERVLWCNAGADLSVKCDATLTSPIMWGRGKALQDKQKSMLACTFETGGEDAAAREVCLGDGVVVGHDGYENFVGEVRHLHAPQFVWCWWYHQRQFRHDHHIYLPMGNHVIKRGFTTGAWAQAPLVDMEWITKHSPEQKMHELISEHFPDDVLPDAHEIAIRHAHVCATMVVAAPDFDPAQWRAEAREQDVEKWDKACAVNASVGALSIDVFIETIKHWTMSEAEFWNTIAKWPCLLSDLLHVSVLSSALVNKRWETARTLLCFPQVNVNAVNCRKKSPLHVAIACRAPVWLVTALVEAGAFVGALDADGFTPLDVSAIFSHGTASARALLNLLREALPFEQAWPLLLRAHSRAIEHGNFTTASLIRSRAMTTIRSRTCPTPRVLAEMLLQFGITPLHHAVLSNDPERVALLRMHPFINYWKESRDWFGLTPLHYATESAPKTMSELLKLRVDANAELLNSCTALGIVMLAKEGHDKKEKVRVLRRAGAYVPCDLHDAAHVIPEHANTIIAGVAVLHSLIAERAVETEKERDRLLTQLERIVRIPGVRLDIVARDPFHGLFTPPLHWAIARGDHATVVVLIAAGASLETRMWARVGKRVCSGMGRSERCEWEFRCVNTCAIDLAVYYGMRGIAQTLHAKSPLRAGRLVRLQRVIRDLRAEMPTGLLPIVDRPARCNDLILAKTENGKVMGGWLEGFCDDDAIHMRVDYVIDATGTEQRIVLDPDNMVAETCFRVFETRATPGAWMYFTKPPAPDSLDSLDYWVQVSLDTLWAPAPPPATAPDEAIIRELLSAPPKIVKPDPLRHKKRRAPRCAQRKHSPAPPPLKAAPLEAAPSKASKNLVPNLGALVDQPQVRTATEWSDDPLESETERDNIAAVLEESKEMADRHRRARIDSIFRACALPEEVHDELREEFGLVLDGGDDDALMNFMYGVLTRGVLRSSAAIRLARAVENERQ